jgi:hypothetical protein
MSSLLYLPIPVSFLIIIGLSVFISIAGLKLVRRRFSADSLKENHEVAGFIFNAFGLIYAVLLAFVVYATWTDYNEAKHNIEIEANKLSDLFIDVEGFPEPVKSNLQKQILVYSDCVVNDEWKKMEIGGKSDAARESIEKIFREYLSVEVRNLPNVYIYQESLKRLNELSEYRRLRILSGSDYIPGVIWFVVIIGAVISIGYTYFFGSRRAIAQYIMTAALAITNSMVLFLIYILDHPFTGLNAISAEPFKLAGDLFRHLLGGG